MIMIVVYLGHWAIGPAIHNLHPDMYVPSITFGLREGAVGGHYGRLGGWMDGGTCCWPICENAGGCVVVGLLAGRKNQRKADLATIK